MKLAVLTVLALVLVSCKPSSDDIRPVCIDGVKYVYYKSGYRAVLSVKLNKDSKVELCE